MADVLTVLDWLLSFHRPVDSGSYVVTYDPATGHLSLYRKKDAPCGRREVIQLTAMQINEGLTSEQWEHARAALAAVSAAPSPPPAASVGASARCHTCMGFDPDKEVIVLHGATGGGTCHRGLQQARRRSSDYCQAYAPRETQEASS